MAPVSPRNPFAGQGGPARSKRLGLWGLSNSRLIVAVVVAAALVAVVMFVVQKPRSVLSTVRLEISNMARGGSGGTAERRFPPVHKPCLPDTGGTALIVLMPDDAHAGSRTASPYEQGGERSGTDASLSSLVHLYFSWIGMREAGDGAMLRQVLCDAAQQTDALLDVHMLVDKELFEAQRKAASSSGVSPVPELPACAGCRYLWYSQEAYIARSGLFRHLCNEFSAGHFPTCTWLAKPLLWEILPPEVEAVISLDADLRIAGDIRDLWSELRQLRMKGAVLALAPELQPTYRAMMKGVPLAENYWGFNGGVQLIDVAGERNSELYRSLMQYFHFYVLPEPLQNKDMKVLGDQSLYTLLNLTAPSLFHELGCEWNRQVCRYWFDVTKAVFPGGNPSQAQWAEYEEHYVCPASAPAPNPAPSAANALEIGRIRVLHGNCKVYRPGTTELNGDTAAWVAKFNYWQTNKRWLAEEAANKFD